MTDDDFDGADLSMYLLKTLGQKLISRETALEIARMVLRDRHGDTELARQSPLSIAEDGTDWVISGCDQMNLDSGSVGTLRTGRIRLRISQIDGRITMFALDSEITGIGVVTLGGS